MRRIRLTENELYNVIRRSVKRALSEAKIIPMNPNAPKGQDDSEGSNPQPQPKPKRRRWDPIGDDEKRRRARRIEWRNRIINSLLERGEVTIYNVEFTKGRDDDKYFNDEVISLKTLMQMESILNPESPLYGHEFNMVFVDKKDFRVENGLQKFTCNVVFKMKQ